MIKDCLDVRNYDVSKNSNWLKSRLWISEAIEKISADFKRSSDTHLLKIDIPAFPHATLYLKDESTHPTGSLKHRLARSLFLYSLCNGHIGPETIIIEASSGSTAISEAYFAKLLGLRFIAVVPACTAQEKLDHITFYGGEIHKVNHTDLAGESRKLAENNGGYFMDQFTYAERATDWRGNNNIAVSMFEQMALEQCPEPDWIIMGAGTGGTTATIGRYLRYHPELFSKTKLCCVDPENSVLFDYYKSRILPDNNKATSKIEGIGRPVVPRSFMPNVIDRMLHIPDAASIAAIWWFEKVIGRKVGGSTGTNLFGALKLIIDHDYSAGPASFVSLICDRGDRYLDTYYNRDWLQAQNIDIDPYLDLIEKNFGTP